MKRDSLSNLEAKRLALQAELDGAKTQAERNELGQFATPTGLAQDVLRYAASLLPAGKAIRFLDPGFGTGAFYSALLSVFPRSRISEAVGFELDKHYAEPTAHLWRDYRIKVKVADFTKEEPEARFNLIICNPPYVRHHHLQNGEKSRLQRRTLDASGMKISGLAGLYTHFLGLSHGWMEDGAIAGWLIPSEFMDVNYGRAVKHYLLHRVTLLHIHRFDPNDVQFADALVSSAIVWFANAVPPKGHEVTFSFGGTLSEPRVLRKVSAQALAHEPKWTRFPVSDVRAKGTTPTVSDFFKITRGLATGDNSYFILSEEQIRERGLPMEVFKLVLPSPRYLSEDEVKADANGNPLIERRRFLLDTRMSEDEIELVYPALWKYLEEGKSRGLHERYLCRHRSVWYSQEVRPPAPIVCTYLGRGDGKRAARPFRFILNESKATAANVYLMMYPMPGLARAVAEDPTIIRRAWKVLNEITPDKLLGEGRVYGGGLHKLEPRELANVPVPQLADLLPKDERPMKQTELFTH